MTNLETMEKGLDFTMKAYKDYYIGQLVPDDLHERAIEYSAEALYKVITTPNGMCNNYTRADNLRQDMASLGKDAIKNELLRNIVNVATYYITGNARARIELGDCFRRHMNSDQMAVVLFNNITMHGVEKGYELLNDPNVLFSACVSFAKYRSPGKREAMDHVGRINNVVMYVHRDLDVYYARYGDRKDVSNMTGFSYLDKNGHGRK